MKGGSAREPPAIARGEDLSLKAEGVERPNIEDFEGIYGRYTKHRYSLCPGKPGSEWETQDLAKEAFLRLFGTLDTFRGESCR